MHIYTKDSLITALKEINTRGWIENIRQGNAGGIGNTLEFLLGIKENNLPLPNAAEWELKTQRINSSSLVTLFHCEPSPRAIKFVPQEFLPKYGWAHQEAGRKYLSSERSFRQTIHGKNFSDRGFSVRIDSDAKKICIDFNASCVSEKHAVWLDNLRNTVGLNPLDPQPYWGFADLEHKTGTKLTNCFFVQAEVKTEQGKEFYKYIKILMLQNFSFEGFLSALQEGDICIDFDARTGHNHGTKFRMRQNCLPQLYSNVTIIL